MTDIESTPQDPLQEIATLRNRVIELEQLLDSSEKRCEFLASVLDSLNGFVTVWDFNGTFTYGNQTFFERSGFKRENVIGKSATEIYPPQELARLSHIYKELEGKPDGACVKLSNHGLSSSGEWVAIEGQVVKNFSPPINGYVGFGREAIQGASVTGAYQQSVEAMSVILNSVQDALLIHDRSGFIVQFNQKLLEMFKIDRLDTVLRPKNVAYFLSPVDEPVDFNAIWHEALSGQVRQLEQKIIRPSDGKIFDAEIFMRSIRLQGEDHILVSIKDITEKKRIADELHRALALAEHLRVKAEAASDTKSKFLANMSHELRTPLNAILGFSELLEGKWYGEINEKQLAYVRAIYNSGDHLLHLINDILDLAKVEAGKMEISASSTDLDLLLENAFTMIKETAYKAGIKLELEIGDEFKVDNIWADDVRLKQIIMNLLSNAVKFTPSGGTIRLQAQKLDQETRISVSDTGIGIKPEDQARVFEEFEQVDSSFSRQQQGTGLGLSLTRKLVELHGGRIWVTSEGDNKGSVFTFEIPYVSGGPKQERSLSNAGEYNFGPDSDPDTMLDRPSILVVEDNTANMKLTTNLLEVGGYKTLPAFSSEEALNILKTSTPALILMDISLPGMDGLTATQVIKNNPLTSHIPVVALTAHAMKDDRQRAIEAGCDAYLLKPIDTRQFYRTISRLLVSRDSKPEH